MTVTTIENVLRQLIDNARGGRIIEMIKLVRQETGLGLKEAKDLVEDMRSAFESFAGARAGRYGFESSEHVVSYTNSYGEPVTQIFNDEGGAVEEARWRATKDGGGKDIRVARVTHRGVATTTIERV